MRRITSHLLTPIFFPFSTIFVVSSLFKNASNSTLTMWVQNRQCTDSIHLSPRRGIPAAPPKLCCTCKITKNGGRHIFFISKDWQQHLYSCINKNKKQRMSKHWVYACSSSPLSPQNQSPLSIWKNYIYPSSCIQLWHKGPAGSEDNIVHIWKLRNKNVGTQPHFHCRFCSSTLSPFSSQPYLSSDWLPQTGWFCLCVNLGPNPQVSVKTICDQHYWIRFLQCVWIFCIHRRAETCKVSCSNI